MDLEKRRTRYSEDMNKRMYMDLKDIVKEHTLPFLPAKSLHRFKAVCWDWNRWISSPFLSHNQSYSYHVVSGLFSQSQESPPSFISLDPNSYGVPDPSLEFLQVPVDIKASCNGLLCCQAHTNEKDYYICNPVTKQFKILPKPNCNHGENSAVVLIFEPSLLSFSANYKLVCAFPSSDFDDGHEFEIYSSETASWKHSGEICFGKWKLAPESGVHVKGIVYWMSTSYIVAFDLAKDRCRLIDGYCLERGCLGEMHGELCYVNINNRTISIRTMSNAYSNTTGMSSIHGMWSHKRRIILNDLNNVLGKKILSKQKPALFFISGTVVVADVGEDDAVLSYDMKMKQTTIVCGMPRAGTGRYIPYVNSLSPLI